MAGGGDPKGLASVVPHTIKVLGALLVTSIPSHSAIFWSISPAHWKFNCENLFFFCIRWFTQLTPCKIGPCCERLIVAQPVVFFRCASAWYSRNSQCAIAIFFSSVHFLLYWMNSLISICLFFYNHFGHCCCCGSRFSFYSNFIFSY